WPECPIDDLGYVDVVFKRPRAPVTDPAVHAFEIDYNPKRKSIEKLLWFGPETTTWIVVFSSNPRPVAIRRVPRPIRIFVVPRACPRESSSFHLPTIVGAKHIRADSRAWSYRGPSA